MSEEAEACLRNAFNRIAEKNQANLPPEKRWASFGQPFCEAEHDGFVCSREKGHIGTHVAHGRLGNICAEWGG